MYSAVAVIKIYKIISYSVCIHATCCCVRVLCLLIVLSVAARFRTCVRTCCYGRWRRKFSTNLPVFYGIHVVCVWVFCLLIVVSVATRFGTCMRTFCYGRWRRKFPNKSLNFLWQELWLLGDKNGSHYRLSRNVRNCKRWCLREGWWCNQEKGLQGSLFASLMCGYGELWENIQGKDSQGGLGHPIEDVWRCWED